MLHTKKSLKQRLLSGGIWSFITKSSASFLTIALAAIITRILPPEDVGVFFLCYSIIVLLSFFARFGLDQFCVRYIGDEIAAQRYGSAKELVNTVLLMVFGMTVCISLLLYLLADFLIVDSLLSDDIGFSIKNYLIVWLPITAFQFLFAEIFRAYHNIKYASIFSGGTIFGGFLPGIIFGVTITIVYLTDNTLYLEEVLQIMFFIMICLLVVEYKVMRQMINHYSGLSNNQEKLTFGIKDILYDTYPFFISALSFMFLVHADTVVLGLYAPESEVAIYNAATRIAKLVVIVYMIILEVIAPVIVELNLKGEKGKLEEILRSTSTLAAASSLLVLLFFIVFAEPLLSTVYGEYYKSGASLLLIMSCGQFVSVLCGPSDQALNMMGHQKVPMYIALITSLIAIFSCVIVAPIYGSVAVAAIIALALIFKSIVAMVYVYKLEGVWTYAYLYIGVKEIKKFASYIKV